MAIEFPFRFNQQYQPGSIPSFGNLGPGNISNQLQTGISKFLDPMLARLKELEVANHAEAIKRGSGFLNPAAPATTSTTAPEQKAPGVLGTPSAPFVNPAAASGSGGGTFAMGQGMDPSTNEPTPGGPGTVPGSPMLQAAKIGIAGVETGHREDPYSAWGKEITKKNGSKDIAVGKYQVMASNVGPWTEKWLGQRMTPDEFRLNPAAQERVFEGEFGSYLDQYGNINDAASKWFCGRPLKQAVAAGARDINIGVPEYVRRANQNIQKAGGIPQPQPVTGSTASFAPPVNPAPTPAAAAAVGAPASPEGPLPRREGTPLPINPPIAAGANVDPQQTAAAAPALGGGQRPAAPEVGAPRPVKTQALGPDGQPLPPQQQPANPLPTGGGTGPQPNPPPPPPAQPPPPPIPAVAPPPPVAQAQAADVVLPPDVPVEHMTLPATPRGASPAAPQRVDPSAAQPPPPVRVAGGAPVPLPQAPARMPQQAPVVTPQQQQQAVQRRLAPIDPQAEQFLLNAYRLARTPEEVYKIGQDIIKLRQGEKPTVHLTREGRMIEYHPGSGLTRDVTPPPSGEVVDPKAWDKAKDLREKFDAEPETRKYRVSQTAVNQIRSSAESGTGVGDISLIYQYIKMLDPDTGVREGEIALANQTGSLPDRVVNTYNNILRGHKLNDKQRKQFVDEASRLLQVRSKGMEEHVEWLKGAARRHKLNPDDIIRYKPYKHEEWLPPLLADGTRRNDGGGFDEQVAARSKGVTRENPIYLGADWETAQKNAKTSGLKDLWGQWPDGSVTQLR